MNKRAKGEFIRTVFHMSSGTTIVLIYGLTNITKSQALIVLGVITLFFLLGDISRQFIPRINLFARKIFNLIMRESEQTGLAASSYYVMGCWLTMLAFEKVVTCICILFLVVGDTLNKIIRNLSRNRRAFYLHLEVTLINFLVSFLLAWFILKFTSRAHPLIPSLLGGLGASAGEAVPKIDNLTIPILGGILLMLGFYLVH